MFLLDWKPSTALGSKSVVHRGFPWLSAARICDKKELMPDRVSKLMQDQNTNRKSFSLLCPVQQL